MTSLEVRSHLVDAMLLDLVGPEPGSPLVEEILPQPPTQWYLTGFLAPFDAEPEQRSEETSDEGLDQANDAGATDDATAPEKQAARKTFFARGWSRLMAAGGLSRSSASHASVIGSFRP